MKKVGSAVKSGFSSAGRMVGRAIGNSVAPVLGGAVGDKIGSTIGKALYGLSKVMAHALIGGVAWVIISLLGAAVTIPFFMFIINSSAHVVPSGNPWGDSPTSSASFECLEFIGFPETALQTELEAAQIIARARHYMDVLCSQGIITMEYRPQVGGYGGFVLGARRIAIYPNGTGSLGNTLYTLAHELGHIHQQVSPVYQTYAQSVAYLRERGVCTYPFLNPVPPSESYPEMIAMYLGGPTPPSGFAGSRMSCFGGNFRTGMPMHWLFAYNSIFGRDALDW